ncbi:solute carrier family facilitated glucose transporter member hypothetical protein [Limosa lapponica baueri]|uniref:ribonuclease H n=1 Tax=Limosa lapponica baueri TaxID=1758121 RepID=A0A2I0THQ3_LIMLA|nr:solute carrier family facilitated glucose transporter member hypothetical protein [Limosa lapponica baueri]
MLMASDSTTQICKIIRHTNPETWDGDIWYDDDDSHEPEEGSNYDYTPETVSIWPLIKTEVTNEGGNDRTTMRTVPWSPTDLAKLQEKYSRSPGESETKYAWLPQGYKHSPAIAHNALVKVLAEISSPQGVTIYQYIDDILIGGDNFEDVKCTLEDLVRKGTAPPADIAQKPTLCKWYAYLEVINEIMPITEDSVKLSKFQKDIDYTLLFQTPLSKSSPIRGATPGRRLPCLMIDLCLITCEMHIKVDTPVYANEDYQDHAKLKLEDKEVTIVS